MPRAGVAVPRGEAFSDEGRTGAPHFRPDPDQTGSSQPLKRDPSRRPRDNTPPTSGGGGVPGRRTVTITGHGAEGYTTRNGTRPSAAARHRQVKRHERAGFRPDRAAMWAVLLGLLLMLAAAASAHAAVIVVHHASAFASLNVH